MPIKNKKSGQLNVDRLFLFVYMTELIGLSLLRSLSLLLRSFRRSLSFSLSRSLSLGRSYIGILGEVVNDELLTVLIAVVGSGSDSLSVDLKLSYSIGIAPGII